jgi:hypothetical protein
MVVVGSVDAEKYSRAKLRNPFNRLLQPLSCAFDILSERKAICPIFGTLKKPEWPSSKKLKKY